MALELLKQRIDTLRKKIYFLIAVHGISKIVFLLLFFALATFLLDYFLILPRILRLLLFLAGSGALAYYAYRFLALPFQIEVPDDDIAIAIEKANPFLKDKLISALQFVRLLENPNYKDSISMSQRVVEEAERIAGEVSFSGILEIRRALFTALVPLGMGCLIFFAIYLFPNLYSLSGIWMDRNLLLKNTPWPQRTYLFLLEKNFVVSSSKPVSIEVQCDHSLTQFAVWYKGEDGGLWNRRMVYPQNGHAVIHFETIKKSLYFYLQDENEMSGMYRILPGENPSSNVLAIKFPDYAIVRARGESLFLKVITRGAAPRNGKIHYLFKEGKAHVASLVKQGEGVFQYDFQTLIEDFSFYFEGNDDNDQLPVYHVKVLNPPTTESVDIWYLYPPYTKIEPTPWQTPQSHGNINALVGSQVVLRAKVNIPIEVGKIVFSGKYESILAPVSLSEKSAIPSLPSAEGYLFAQFPIQQDARYQIELIAKNDLPDPNPASFYIRALRDQPPYPQIVLPKRRMLHATVKGRLPLEFKTSDDFGISKLVLHYKIGKSDWQEISLSKEHNDKEYPEKEITSQYLFEFSKLVVKQDSSDGGVSERPLRKGDPIAIKLIAFDNNDVSGVGVKESQVIALEILDDAELGALLHGRLKEVKMELRKAFNKQFKVKQELQIFESSTTDLEMGDIAAVLQHSFAQQAISRDISGQGESLSDVLQTIQNNDLWDVYTRQKIEKVESIVRTLSFEEKSGHYQGNSAEAAKFLMESHQSLRSDQKKGKSLISEAIVRQGTVLQELEKAIGMLSEWEDFNEVVRDIEEMIELQKKISPRLQKLIEKK